jgi:hypothetical protein
LTNTDPTKVAVAHDCQTVYLDNQSRNEAGNRTSWVGEDWDPGYLKGECGPYRYIKGIAHPELGDQYPARATAILCCSARFDIIP